jgi:DNA polymerase-1
MWYHIISDNHQKIIYKNLQGTIFHFYMCLDLLKGQIHIMKKVILVDGNNLLFRSYYATAYTGNIMRNKEGFPTNGLFGFVNMMNKIINEEKPEYIAVAFDVGKTFRHDEYEDYKGGRNATPDDLKAQFPVAKEILTALGIKYLECPGYEADDIIGTLAKMVDKDTNFTATIVSSDKDLLQLISDEVEVKLLKTKDYIRMNKQTFIDTYGIEPIRMIDLKGLMGDSSDNIPGVKGVGEKTALKLLQEYDTVENVYNNIDNIKGALKTKLENDKESAFMSKKIATIYKDAPIDITLEDIKLEEVNRDKLINIYTNLEFHSFLKNLTIPKVNTTTQVTIITDITKLNIQDKVAINIELDIDNYHYANILGLSIYNPTTSIYIPGNLITKELSFLEKLPIVTYDSKKLYVSLKKIGLELSNIQNDIMIMAYLLNYNVKDDIAYLANDLGYNLEYNDKKEKLSQEELANRSIKKAKFIYDLENELEEKIKEEELTYLYKEIELPLAIVLGNMEYTGIRVDKKVLEDMGNDIEEKISNLTEEIYTLAGTEFNISSPKQLGDILFNKLNLPFAKKNKTGYVTDSTVLNKLISYPIVEKILEYRMLTKLFNTYIEGIINSIGKDNKIHTIYTQTLTRTGRLSSIEPNLQNIPVRNEYGKLIRKAFIPEENSLIMSSDYSQIELRMFAHLSNNQDLIEAFNNKLDIHTKTASDIFKVPIEEVTKDMRRNAKAVNFGIIYGISSYGLSEDLKIPPKEAKNFIDKYFETYPGIKEYMSKTIEEAHKLGYVKTIMNRKRIINELNDSNHNVRNLGERMALNTPIQGSSADLLKKAMIEINNYLKEHKLKSTMILQVHDELIFNCHKDEQQEVINAVTNIMENTYKLKVPLLVDVELGSNWYDAK